MCNAPCDEHTIVHSLINRVHVGDLDTGRRMIFLAIQIHEHAAVFSRPHPPPYPLDHRNTVTSVNIYIYIYACAVLMSGFTVVPLLPRVSVLAMSVAEAGEEAALLQAVVLPWRPKCSASTSGPQVGRRTPLWAAAGCQRCHPCRRSCRRHPPSQARAPHRPRRCQCAR